MAGLDFSEGHAQAIAEAIGRRELIQSNLTKLRKHSKALELLAGKPGMPPNLTKLTAVLIDACALHLLAGGEKKTRKRALLVDVLLTSSSLFAKLQPHIPPEGRPDLAAPTISNGWQTGIVFKKRRRDGKEYTESKIVPLEERLAVVAYLVGIAIATTTQLKECSPAELIDRERTTMKKQLEKWETARRELLRLERGLRARGVQDPTDPELARVLVAQLRRGERR
ncbi:MAG TPA: hypothetical protein VK841_11915 [Polyangiaceae bacterium]|nr:hypothetical protein [Polyangiaceae bacterium]